MPRREIRGYVLAGGRSSRMGTDKAELLLGGRTLLETVTATLRQVCGDVVLVGERTGVPLDVRVIPDLHPGCGPMGGIEAALRDAERRSAVFLPVDMPFVPAALLGRVVELWRRSEAAVCFAVVDGAPQPLVSLLSPEARPAVEQALLGGSYKVRPVLEQFDQHGGGRGGLLRTAISTGERLSVWPDWQPTDAEWAARELWFSNLNTPEEFALAEALAGSLGE